MATIGLDKLFYADITEDANGNETYAKCAESVIIFDLSFEKRIQNLIHAQDAFFDEIHYCSLKRALIHRLNERGELDENFCIEMIKINEAQRIRY